MGSEIPFTSEFTTSDQLSPLKRIGKNRLGTNNRGIPIISSVESPIAASRGARLLNPAQAEASRMKNNMTSYPMNKEPDMYVPHTFISNALSKDISFT